MTCSRALDRLLQATCVGLVGMLAVGGCGGGSSTSGTSDAAPPRDTAIPDTINRDTAPLAPVLTVSPGFLNFNEVDINQNSPPQSVTVTNTGALVALNPTVDGGGFAISAQTCGTPSTSCTISIVFTPTSVGAKNAILSVNAGLTVSLSGLGRTPGTFNVAALGVPTAARVGESSSITVTVTATGPLTGLSCLASGADLAADAANTTCTGTIDASASCKYGFTFKATTAGDKNENIACSGGGTVRNVAVTPTVVAGPSLAINPASATVSAGVGATPATTFTFNVGNIGGSTSGTLSTAISGLNADQFTITDSKCFLPLDAHASCAIVVAFNPTTAGPKTAALTVTDATPGSTPLSAPLTGTGISGPVVTITGLQTLPVVEVGQASAPATYTVTNTGGAATGALTVAVGDPTFAISGDTCSGSTLAPSKACTLVLTFTPTATGSKIGILTVSSGTPMGNYQINATGRISTPAALSMGPTSLDFATIGVGIPSTAQVFTVTNSGGTATGALAVTRTDSASGVGGSTQFAYTTTCQAVLDPAATCQIVVTFKPTIAGNASATFAVSDGKVSSPPRTAIGTAIDKPGLSLSCPQTAFADTVIGQTSPALVCTVSNNVTSKQDSGAITPTLTGDFAVSTNNCTASLAPGLSCTLSIAFTPTLKGARTGTITVTGANGGAANQNLTGSGLGIIEIQEFTAPATGFVPNPVTGDIYDFGTVSAGATSATTVILAVYVRGTVTGNLSVAKAFGTPPDFTQVTGAVDLTWPGTAAHTSVAACVGLTTAAPTPSKTVPYCTLVLSFTPQSKADTKTGTVTATSGTSTDAATVKGRAAGPLSVDPSPLTFAAVAKGTAGTAMTLTVCNNAATNATGAQFAITGPNAADFAVALDQVSNATITGGTCVNLALRLDIPPGETAAALSATLTVSATIAGATESDVASLVGASASGAVLQATLGTSTFPDTAITATSAAAVVTVSNTGGLGTGTLNFTIPAGSEFTMRTGAAQGTCAPTCATNGLTCTAPALAAAASCTLRVWFSPTATLGVGGRTDTLSVSSDSGALTVLPLAANALSQITATPDPLALGPSGVGGLGGPIKTVTVQNVGADNATMTVAFRDFGTQTGAGVGAFRLNPATPDCAGALAAGDSCAIGVQMFTTTLGIFSTTMLVTNTANGQSASVVVTGTAAEAVLQFTPVTHVDRDLGTIPMGATSGTIRYTVTNVGGLTSGPISFDLYDESTPGVPATTPHLKTSDFPFSTGTGVCKKDGTSTLAPGASCNIDLAFNPQTCDSPCISTTSPLHEYLIVKATPGTPTLGLTPNRISAATANAAAVYMVSGPAAAPPNAAPFDFGTPTAAQTVTLALYNPTATPFTLPATATFTSLDPNLPGMVAPATNEFEIVAATATGTCGGFGGGAALLPAGNPTAPSTCTFSARWTPRATSAVGTRGVSVAVGGVSMDLYARVAGPAVLVANPSSLNFGNVSQNGATATLTVVVSNIGDAATTGNLGRTKAGTGSGDLSWGSGCTGAVLAAGLSCNLVVSVDPTNTVPGDSTITVQSPPSPATAAQSLAIPVTWTGTNVNAAAINLTPTIPAGGLTFGPMAVLATSAAQTLTLTNPARGLPTGPLSFAVENADFAVDATGAGGCGDLAHADGLTPTAAAADSCTVALTFRPRPPLGAAPDNRVGHLTIKSTYVNPAAIALNGTAIAALSVSNHATASSTAEDPLVNGGCTFTDPSETTPAGCAYGTRPVVAAAFRSETYTFQNAAGTPATGSLAVDLTGTGAPNFRIVRDTCAGVSLDSSATCKVTVRFSPATAGAKSASLTVSATQGDSVTVTLTGTGN